MNFSKFPRKINKILNNRKINLLLCLAKRKILKKKS